ncbi:hypothetical protein AVEN_196901-1 [Araneus ventricosus]|uniref:Uncharacterized protein n=1 Tax=Araneus ventricosus TaxID=182803 RepID=A0A4Y2ECU3_ARAVE|nr:hypothetical protein AVEN_196901-1 [Araneus ventricosus]
MPGPEEWFQLPYYRLFYALAERVNWVVLTLSSRQHLLHASASIPHGGYGCWFLLGSGLPSSLDLKDIKKLSTDQQYLYRIYFAIKDGSCCSSITDNGPGKLSHARWLSTPNRLLPSYIDTPSPLQNLIILVNYAMLVYAPMWFEIKMKSNCQYGAQHFCKMISLARQLPDNVKQIIYKVFSNNAYFAHTEHLSLTMLHESSKHVRESAVRRFLGARDNKTKNSGGLRFSKLPKLNFEAANYIDLIDWSNCVVTETTYNAYKQAYAYKEQRLE